MITGVVAAGTLPLTGPGLGWLLTGAALVGAWIVGAVTRRARHTAPGNTAPDSATAPDAATTPQIVGKPRRGNLVGTLVRYAWAAAALALLSVGVLRAAGWFFTLCLLVALVAGVQALAGGPAVRGMVLSFFAVPVGAVRSVPWAVRGALRLRTTGASGLATLRLLLSLGVAGLLLVVFGVLFASADPAFADLASRVLPTLDLVDLLRWIFLLPAFGFAAVVAAYFGAAPPEIDDVVDGERRSLRLLEWALPVLLLDLLFATFVAVQLTVLFGGRRYVLGVGGPNYAEYARGGFWQLLVVTLLTLGVLAIAARAASRRTRADRLWVRVLLGVLSGLTLVIVASAVRRMALYEEAYGYSRLRLLVSAVELWLGLLFVLVLVAGVRLRGRWLPRAVLGTAVAGLLGLAVLNPDRFIAEQNVARYERIHRIDLEYLSQLSADAVPALDRLPDVLRPCALGQIAADLEQDSDSWHSYNLGRARARQILKAAPVWHADAARQPAPTCVAPL